MPPFADPMATVAAVVGLVVMPRTVPGRTVGSPISEPVATSHTKTRPCGSEATSRAPSEVSDAEPMGPGGSSSWTVRVGWPAARSQNTRAEPGWSITSVPSGWNPANPHGFRRQRHVGR